MFQSIRAKIVAIYSLVTVIFTSTLLCTIYINEREQVLNFALEKSTEISELHANLVSAEFRQYVSMLMMVRDQHLVKVGDISHIVSKLKRLVTVADGAFTNAVYVDRNLNLTDTKGYTGKVTHPLFLKGEQWASREYNISVPIFSRFEKDPVIMVAVPILDAEGKWMGTIAASVSLEFLSDRLSSIKLAKGSYAWLSDSNGVIASHPNQDYVMTVKLKDSDNLGYPGFPAIFEKSKIQDNGYGQYMDTNIDDSKIVTFAKVDYLPGWTLFVTTRESEILSDINIILFNVLLTSVILMGLFLFVINRLINRVTRPIAQLTHDVKYSVNNRFRALNVVDSRDEIGQLSRAFSETINRVHHYTDNLEELVSQRTEELATKNSLLNEKNRELEKIASRDPLTKLYNRRAFTVFVEKEISRVTRHHKAVSLIVVDIDHFKNVNDTYGHDVGDDVLSHLAHILSVNTRKENVVCRWGGEEFVILMPEATADMALASMEGLRKTISQTDFSPVGTLTVSAGVAVYHAGEPFKEWVNRADAALYEAKAAGRNCVKVA